MLYNFGLCAIKAILEQGAFVDESAEPALREGWTVDTRRFCERKERLEAAFGPAELPRLGAESVQSFAPITVAVDAVDSPRGLRGLRVKLDGEVTLTCQRCLQPVVVELRHEALFELVDSSAALDADDDEEWDRLLHSDRCDLVHVVEDEMLLALPYSPRHERCVPVERMESGEKASPFARLAVLKGAQGR